MKMNYDIGGLCISLEADYPLIENEYSKLFRVEADDRISDWKCILQAVEEMPLPQGRKIASGADTVLYLDGTSLWHQYLEPQERQAVFLAEYPLSGPGDVRFWAKAEFQPVTAQLGWIWSAMDFPYQMLRHEVLIMHSSVVEVHGEAILFIAPSGIGKSTQAALWQNLRGARQLNGDKVAVSSRNGAAEAWGVPFCGTSDICHSFHLPIRAIVLLSQAPENRVTRLKGIQAVAGLAKNCFGHLSVPGCSEKIMTLLTKLLAIVPVYSLACTPDERAVETLEKVLYEEG